ncbi:MAG TPA: hypothetical protein VFU49_13275, partial [Ktedonobacteraceae bacterium]|nr:hypothetical protein [Ktedonobacteraceae bacterium]
GIPTMVGGYLTTSNEINTVIAAGRADLCILTPPQLKDQDNHLGEPPGVYLANPLADAHVTPSTM